MSEHPKSDAVIAAAKAHGHPVNVLRHHVTGAIERGEATAVIAITNNDRPITLADAESCHRGLTLHRRTVSELLRLISTHTRSTLFASSVIVIAAANELDSRGRFDPADYSVRELHAMAKHYVERFRGAIAAELARRETTDIVVAGTIEPVADPHETGDWHAVPEGEATMWTFWPSDTAQPAEHFESRAAAEAYQRTGKMAG